MTKKNNVICSLFIDFTLIGYNTGLHVVKLWIFWCCLPKVHKSEKIQWSLAKLLVGEDGVRFHSMCGKRVVHANRSLILWLQVIWCGPVMEDISRWAGVGSDSGQGSGSGRPFRRMSSIGLGYE